MSAPLADLSAGDELPEQTYPVTRADLVRYAGASGDFNPIHWSDRVAGSVGLPGVIAHGMFTLALAARGAGHLGRRPGPRPRARVQVHQARRGPRRRDRRRRGRSAAPSPASPTRRPGHARGHQRGQKVLGMPKAVLHG